MFLKEQTYITTLAEVGTITGAAQRLYISQPALSAYIRSVEDSLGTALFRREGKVYIPTDIGERYLERAQQMLDLQDDFNLELSLMNKGMISRVRVGIQTRRAPVVIAPILSYFANHHPDTEVIFEESNSSGMLRMLDERKLDMVIFTASERILGLDYIDIYPEELVLAVPHDHPVRRFAVWEKEHDQYQSLDLKHLSEDVFFMPHHSQSLRVTCNQLFLRTGFTPRKIVEIRNIEAIMTLVAEGLGVGFNRVSYTKHLNLLKVLNKVSYYKIIGDQSQADFVIAYKSVPRSNRFKEMLHGVADVLRKQA